MKRALALLLGLTAATLLAAPPGWHTDFTKAQNFASKTHKSILLNFTGSDWCSWCKRMKAETLGKKDFISYASTNLLLVELDFPNSLPQPQSERATNEALQARYKVGGFPTFILVDAEGNELGRQGGYLKGGVTAFVAKLDEWKAKLPKPSSAAGEVSAQ